MHRSASVMAVSARASTAASRCSMVLNLCSAATTLWFAVSALALTTTISCSNASTLSSVSDAWCKVMQINDVMFPRL
ncbi:hypothetical protein L1987_15021 [Smallanthus sonchifolius]|uniref:Uncharacterized protein n=1 Tax=Smallanthus sonchifolius TaxID=185202 RepID=A0ACB9J6N1_9ASTR|nr:hypothetical protein L1987_15021 [Smallanthus sonchifolius]